MIVAVPPVTPQTLPVEEPTVAILVLLLLHVPPDGLELSVLQTPLHIDAVPVIAAGVALTVTVAVADADEEQADTEYVITVVPGATEVTIPEVDPIVATDVLLLLHVPPAVPVGLVKVILAPVPHIGVLLAILPPVGAEHKAVITTLPLPVELWP